MTSRVPALPSLLTRWRWRASGVIRRGDYADLAAGALRVVRLESGWYRWQLPRRPWRPPGELFGCRSGSTYCRYWPDATITDDAGRAMANLMLVQSIAVDPRLGRRRGVASQMVMFLADQYPGQLVAFENMNRRSYGLLVALHRRYPDQVVDPCRFTASIRRSSLELGVK